MLHRLEHTPGAALAVAEGNRRIPVRRGGRMRQHGLQAGEQRFGAHQQGFERRRIDPAQLGCATTASLLTMNTCSPGRGRSACTPVKAPKAGSTPTARRNGKHGRRRRGGPGRPQHSPGAGGRPAHKRRAAARVMAQRQATQPQRARDRVHTQAGRRVAERGRRGCRAPAAVAAAWRLRHCASACSVAGAWAWAECNRSPRKTTRRAPLSSMASLSRCSVCVVVPRGTGTPRRRKDTALPMCASATSRQRSSTNSAVRCAISARRTPATSISITRRRGQALSRRSAKSRCSVGNRLKPERA